MSSNLARTYVQYGVPSIWAERYSAAGLSATQFRATKLDDLERLYRIDRAEAAHVKSCLQRSQIDDDIMNVLLERSAHLCSLCQNIQDQLGYVVHHIVEYAESQDNSYDNLIVLCPSHHDMAHSKSALTRRLSVDDLRRAKLKWETTVEKHRLDSAAGVAAVEEIDYLNIPRIDELARQVLGDGLQPIKDAEKVLFDPAQSTVVPLINLVSDGVVRWSYLEAFRDILHKLKFENLDGLLNARSLQSPQILGTFCYYVGGLYGSAIPWPLTNSTPTGRLYLRRRRYRVEWPIIPTYICSSTSHSRLVGRAIHAVYGRIRNVATDVDEHGRNVVKIDVRPYVIGWPKHIKDRTPLIRYIKEAVINSDDDDAPPDVTNI